MARTFYFDFVGGSDSNTSTQAQSKTTPWKRHPYMTGFTGSYSHTAGDRFIFKGATTWTGACFPLTPTTGGSSGAGNDYYGVDSTWFAGASWSQPVFDLQYATNVGIHEGSGIGFITIDDLELCHSLTTVEGTNGLITVDTPNNSLISNCYLHGWKTTLTTDEAHGGLICGAGFGTNNVIENCEIENSELSGVKPNGIALRYGGIVRNCLIHDVSSAVLFTQTFHDNTLYNVAYPLTGASANVGFDTGYHSNVIYIDGAGPGNSSFVYDNTVYNCAGGAGFFYPNPHGGQFQYVYNNRAWGNFGVNGMVLIDTYNYGSGVGGNAFVMNNTFVFDNNNAIRIVGLDSIHPILDSLVQSNNHLIGSSVGISNATQGSNVTTLTTATNLPMSAATATTQGYVLGNNYAPTALSNSTVGAGTNENAFFTTDILGVVRGSVWDIGAYEYVAGSSIFRLGFRITTV